MKLTGKAALVSGAGGGICRAIALAFAEAGAAVACCDIDAAFGGGDGASCPRCRTVGRSSSAATLPIEARPDAAAAAAHAGVRPARHPGQRRRAARSERHDPRDEPRRLAARAWRQPDRLVSAEPRRAALMIAAGGGSIIFIASQLGRVGSAGRAAYCATKGALIQLAKVMAIDHAAQNIRVNTLSPERSRRSGRCTATAASRRAGNAGPKASAGPPRPPARNRRGRGVSRQRRGELCYRQRSAGRRRLYRDLIAPVSSTSSVGESELDTAFSASAERPVLSCAPVLETPSSRPSSSATALMPFEQPTGERVSGSSR